MTAALPLHQDLEGGREHLGVDRQERLCRDLAGRDGLTVLDVLVDNDLSAYNGKCRPAFERMFQMLRAGQVGAVYLPRRPSLPSHHRPRALGQPGGVERAQVHTVAAGNVDLTTASGRMAARMRLDLPVPPGAHGVGTSLTTSGRFVSVVDRWAWPKAARLILLRQ